ncbi:zinc finger and SCAN domain-containing protein 5B-like [Loxodonta africana]|uniref:zinc finger and SCAN domain-containing protein 5B-like n=1 Tax=Loxodonta africana TaxID=9785 RepID=UPI0030D3D768
MAVDLTSSWRHGKPSEDCGSESPQLMSSQEADLGEKDYDPETWHVNFRAFTSSEGADPIGDLKRLSELCRLWLRPDLHTKEQILDKLVLEQFMISMPLDLQVLVKESGVKNCKDLEEMLRNNRRPVTWSVVCLQGQEFLLPNPDVQMAGSEASDMDDGQKLLPEAISANGELECPRPEQNLEENLMEDREGSTACDAQGSQLLKGSGDSVGANDGKNPKEDTSIKNVDADTPPTLILEREVSTPGGNREDSQKNLRRSKRRKSGNSSNSQGRPHEGATHLDKREFLAQVGLHQIDSPRTMGPTHHDSPSATGPVDHDSSSTVGSIDHTVGQGQDSTGLSLYQCGFCEKRFHYKSQFDIHQRTHTGERPFKCSFCGKGFMQPSDVRVHQRIHTGEKPFKCELCHREFTHESTLHGHKRTHTNEKPFHCTECGKHFSHKGNLNVHRRIHSGTKPYSCPKCGHTFRQLGTFKRHEKTHSKMASQ